MKVRGLAIVLAVLMAFVSCGQPAGKPLPSAPPRGVLIRFGKVTLRAGVVAGPEGRSKGLMNRKKLRSDTGLLFLFPEEVRGGFWMKNTLIPLSIAFLGWGGGETVVVRQRMKMEPCREDPCPLYTPRVRYDAALEVNQGWFERNGIERGSVGEVIGDLPRPR